MNVTYLREALLISGTTISSTRKVNSKKERMQNDLLRDFFDAIGYSIAGGFAGSIVKKKEESSTGCIITEAGIKAVE